MPNISVLAIPKGTIQPTKPFSSSSGSPQSQKAPVVKQSGTFQHYLKNQSSTNTTENKVNSGSDLNSSSSSSPDKQIQPKELKKLKQVVEALSYAKALPDKPNTLIQQLANLLKGPSAKMVSFLKSDQGQHLIRSLQETVNQQDQNSDQNDRLLSELLATIQQITQGVQMNKTHTPTLVSQSDAVPQSAQKPGTVNKSDTGSVEGHTFKKQEGQMSSTNRLTGTGIANANQPALKGIQPATTHLKQTHFMTVLGSNSGGSGGSAKDLPQKSTSDHVPMLISSSIGNPQQMGKVQQFLFHAQNAPSTRSPADQLLTKIQQVMSQGQIKNASGGGLTIQLQLHPDTLGPVQLTITQTDEGLSAVITAHSSLTKELIEGQLSHLEQALSAGGIPVHKLDVSLLASQGSQQSSQDNTPFQQPKDQQNSQSDPQAAYQEPLHEEESTDYESFENWLNEVNRS